jgi:hypothetical protein
MTTSSIVLPDQMWRDILRHLLPDPARHEEAGFLFARWSTGGTFDPVEWTALGPESFESRSRLHLELTDWARRSAIQRAHELGCSIIELHSHCSLESACFSPSDLHGFAEVVPHVRWRLAGRPYAAVVVARGSFDACVWLGDDEVRRLGVRLLPDGDVLAPTGLTPLGWRVR